jgi:hypothetical protein
MKMRLLAGAIALALFGCVLDFGSAANAYDTSTAQPRIDIPRIKSVLRLTPEQQAYWPPVEAALRRLARDQVRESESMVRSVSHRVYSFVLDAAAIARIGAAARPLVRVLDDRQKQDAIALCHEMGLGQVLAALN